MSKIVKSVKKVFKKVKTVVKKIVKSKAFKVLLIGAAIYFGGAGIASMMNGGTFTAGVGSAAGTLSSAGSSLMTGNLSAAGSTVSSAWGTAGTVGNTLGASGTMSAGFSATTAGLEAGNLVAGVGAEIGTANVNAANELLRQEMARDVLANSSNEALKSTATSAIADSTAMSVGEGIAASAKTAAATQLIGQGVQAVGSYKQQRDAEEQNKERRENRSWYGMDQAGNFSGVGGGLADLNIAPMSSVGSAGLMRPPSTMTPRPTQPTNIDDLIVGG